MLQTGPYLEPVHVEPARQTCNAATIGYAQWYINSDYSSRDPLFRATLSRNGYLWGVGESVCILLSLYKTDYQRNEPCTSSNPFTRHDLEALPYKKSYLFLRLRFVLWHYPSPLST